MNILEIGLQQGIERGLEQGMMRGVIETCQDLGLSRRETLIKLIEKSSITEETASEQLETYWR